MNKSYQVLCSRHCVVKHTQSNSGTSITENKYCSCALNETNRGGTYSWPEARDGQIVSKMCQYGDNGQIVTRYCNGQIWQEDASMCPTVVTNQFQELHSEVQNVRDFRNYLQCLLFNSIIISQPSLQTIW